MSHLYHPLFVTSPVETCRTGSLVVLLATHIPCSLCVIATLVEPNFLVIFLLRASVYLLGSMWAQPDITSSHWVHQSPGSFPNVEYPGTQRGALICITGYGVLGGTALETHLGGYIGFWIQPRLQTFSFNIA